MNTKKDGISAFPQEWSTFEGDPAYGGQTRVYHHRKGMTLRDWVAGHALTGLCAKPSIRDRSFEEVAADSYSQAEAMLKERERVIAKIVVEEGVE